jgi:hypothetical protein
MSSSTKLLTNLKFFLLYIQKKHNITQTQLYFLIDSYPGVGQVHEKNVPLLVHTTAGICLQTALQERNT